MSDREYVIAGLRDLLAFLEADPGVPVQNWPTVAYYADTLEEVAAIAQNIGVNLVEEPSGHHCATRAFGPVEYRAVHITPDAMADHRAHMTYRGAVHPEPAAVNA